MKQDNKVLNIVAFQVGKIAVIAALYFFAGWIGGFFTLEDGAAPVIWPHAGFAFAVLLIFGYTTLPGLFVGSLITFLAAGGPVLFSFVNAVGNISAILFPAYFIFQQEEFSNALDNYRSVFILILFGVIISPMISASINVFGVYFLQLSPIDSLPSIWGQRWMKDALGILIFTPVLLVWFGNPFPKLKTNQVLEGIAIFLATLGFELLLFIGDIPDQAESLISFLIIPLIIWASLRITIHGSLLINFITAVVFLLGISQFNDVLFNASSLPYTSAVCMIAMMMVTSMIISASMAELKTTQKSLSFLSTHDSLTGLYNRLFFQAEFTRMEKSRLYPISIIMADMDGLKEINDTYGHRTGDQQLINLANLFSEVFRQEDIVSRYGGDEFVILLPDSDASIAKEVIKRIKKKINTYNKEHKELPIQISMGVSTANQGESLERHLKNADKLMYMKKQENKRQ